MEALEMRMTTDLATAIPSEINFNFEELEAKLQQQLYHYNHLVVTEDAIKEAKDDRAALRKLREAIETRRKEVKKQCERPIKEFEAKVKRLTALIDAPIAAIDGQVKTFEEQEREQKRCEIAAAYDELVPETIREIIPLNRIMDPTWLNKATSMKKIREGIETRVKRTNVDMALIDNVQPQYLTAVRTKYIATLDVDVAMQERDKMMAAEQAFQQREAQRAAARPPVKEPAQQPIGEPVGEPIRKPISEPAPIPRQDTRLHNLTLAFMPNQVGLAALMQFLEDNTIQCAMTLDFKLTQCQATALKQFLTANNIQYTKIS